MAIGAAVKTEAYGSKFTSEVTCFLVTCKDRFVFIKMTEQFNFQETSFESRDDEVISISDSSEESNSSETTKKQKKIAPPRPPPPRFSSVQDHLDELCELRPERVRWFVQEDRKWIPFSGFDSLSIEACFRNVKEVENNPNDVSDSQTLYELATVKGGLYEVDVVARECKPIYWKGMLKSY